MKPLLLCLHGWGGDAASFTELREALKGMDMEILTPDLPGFGKEPEPKKAWNTDDYVKWVEKWVLDRFDTHTLIDRHFAVLGHSHGGRIAIKIAINGKLPIDHLYLCAAAGIRHPRHFKRIIGLTLAKTGKTLLKVPGLKALQPLGKKFLYKLVRVHDYEQASDVMRQTLINVTAEDFRPLLPKVLVSTDIFWGKNDRMTPLKDGKRMHSDIKGSRFHVYDGIRHRVHRDKAKQIAEVIVHHLSREGAL